MAEDIKKNEDLAQSFEKPTQKKGGFLKAVIVILILAIVVLAVLYAVSQYTKWDVLGLKKTAATNPATPGFFGPTGDWQAVFLTNGQVYFGRLKNVSSDYPELSDIYYLQVQNVPIQPAQPASGEQGVQPAQQTQQQLVLIKFGTELHRPADKMFINKDHVMFYEDLTVDSPVIKSIEDYKAKQAAQ